jgi:biopolymer transport protein ExbD
VGAARQPDPGDGDLADEAGGGLFAEINITPLTDVFLVMVVIFMVSALAVQSEAEQQKQDVAEEREKVEEEKKSGLKVTLPSGAAKELDITKQSLILVIPVSGDVVVDGTPVPDDKLDNAFRAAFLKDNQMQVVLQADKGVQHGRVVNLMERAKRAGLTRLAIGTTSGG